MSKVWCMGEALIDFVPARTIEGDMSFAPRCGGSPYNAAIAAVRQGANVGFLGGLSRDMFGDQLVQYLQAEGIDVSQAERSEHSTTMAFVDLDGAEPRYAFFNRQSATQLFAPDPDQFECGAGDILHVGSISLIDNPGANNIRAFVEAVAPKMLVSIDPNARPSMTDDIEDWRERQRALLSVASIVKLSEEDLDFLTPGTRVETFVQDQFNAGVGLVVITRAEQGSWAFTPSGKAQSDIVPGPLVDNVGAGDTVTGTILSSLSANGLNRRDQIAALDSEQLEPILKRAMLAAALNCARSGCNPPSNADIDAALAKA